MTSKELASKIWLRVTGGLMNEEASGLLIPVIAQAFPEICKRFISKLKKIVPEEGKYYLTTSSPIAVSSLTASLSTLLALNEPPLLEMPLYQVVDDTGRLMQYWEDSKLFNYLPPTYNAYTIIGTDVKLKLYTNKNTSPSTITITYYKIPLPSSILTQHIDIFIDEAIDYIKPMLMNKVRGMEQPQQGQ